MLSFNETISDLQLYDVPLKGRRFTWTNNQPVPILSRIDRVLVSNAWASNVPFLTLTPLATTTSDDAPLLFRCSKKTPRSTEFRFELLWLNYSKVILIIQVIWQRHSFDNSDPLQTFSSKLAVMQRELTRWHRRRLRSVDTTLQRCKSVIGTLDKLEDYRNLTTLEFSFRALLKEKARELAVAQEIKWKQRSRCRWLVQRDKNTSFFHALASARWRKNYIAQITHNGRVLTTQRQMADLFFLHFSATLGADSNTRPFDPQTLYTASTDFASIDSVFTETEIHKLLWTLVGKGSPGQMAYRISFFSAFGIF